MSGPQLEQNNGRHVDGPFQIIQQDVDIPFDEMSTDENQNMPVN